MWLYLYQSGAFLVRGKRGSNCGVEWTSWAGGTEGSHASSHADIYPSRNLFSPFIFSLCQLEKRIKEWRSSSGREAELCGRARSVVTPCAKRPSKSSTSRGPYSKSNNPSNKNSLPPLCPLSQVPSTLAREGRGEEGGDNAQSAPAGGKGMLGGSSRWCHLQAVEPAIKAGSGAGGSW